MSHNLVETLPIVSAAPKPARPTNTRTLNEVATFAKTLQNLARQESGPETGRRPELPQPAQAKAQERPAPQERPVSERPAQAHPAERPEKPVQKPETPVAKGKTESPDEAANAEQGNGAEVTKPETPKGEGKPDESPRAQVTLPANANGHAGQTETEESVTEAALPLTELVAELATVVLQPMPELAETVSLTQQVDTPVTDAPPVATEGDVSLAELVPVVAPVVTEEADVPKLVVNTPQPEAQAPEAGLIEIASDVVVNDAPVVVEQAPQLVPAVASQPVDAPPEVVITDELTPAPSPDLAPVDELPEAEVELPIVTTTETAQQQAAVQEPTATAPQPVVQQASAVPSNQPAVAETPKTETPRVDTPAMKEVVFQAKEERPAAGEGHRGIGDTVSDVAKVKTIEHLLKPLRGEVVSDRPQQPAQHGPSQLPAQAKADPLQALVEQGKTTLLTVKPMKVDDSPVAALVQQVARGASELTEQQGLELNVEGANDVEAVAVQVGAEGADTETSGDGTPKFQLASAKEIASQIKLGSESKVTAYSDREVMQQVIDRIKQAVNAGKSEVRLRLNPESLGEVHVRIISHQGQVTVRLLTDNPEVQKLVESGMGNLRNSLAEQGVKVNQVHVTHAHEDQQANQDHQQKQEQAKDERQQKRDDRDGVALHDFASMLAKEA